MTATPKSAAGGPSRPVENNTVRPPEAAGPFVLNLTSSTTPMALSNPDQPELKRFSFFVSRRFEEGRERFRLHMGYFNTLAEAEEWLGAVRDIYPGAWAGEAPGKKLRERALAAAAAQAQHAAGPPPPKPTREPVAKAPAPPVLPVAESPDPGIDLTSLNIPTIHAATELSLEDAPAPIAAVGATAVAAAVPAVASAVASAVAPVATAAVERATASAAAPVASPVAARPVAPAAAPMSASTLVPAPAPTVSRLAAASAFVVPSLKAAPRSRTAAAPGAVEASRPVVPNSTLVPVKVPTPAAAAVKTVAAKAVAAAKPAAVYKPAVARTPTAQMLQASPPPVSATAKAAAVPAPALAVEPARSAAKPAKAPGLPNSNVREVLKALDESPKETDTTGETRMMPGPTLAGLDDIAVSSDGISDTQVLKFLETRRADGTGMPGMEVESGAISLLKPDDTVTRRALKEAVKDNAPVWFAVQLQWSVQPVELSKVPPLAIFSAYTLYTVEGSRDGRRWFGLRLGFFSDAIAAKQVAYYVRSEFNSVAVVPVSPQERLRASDTETKADVAYAKKERAQPTEEFKLIDAEHELPVPQPNLRRAAGKPGAPAKTTRAAARTSSRPAAARGGGRVRAREARAPQTLEETLEILGASELEMDNGESDELSESAVRHLRVEVQKNSPFGRLLERLSERVRKP